MKQGDWIKINFLGRVKATGEVFDLTREEDAKKHGIQDQKKRYGPVLVILGGGFIIPGVEKQLLSMEPGEKKGFDVGPAEALGPRRPELLRVISIAKFSGQNITPFPGLVLNVDGRNAKVLSVSGGRVRMDFNHPLAGKELHYDVEIVGKVTGKKEMVDSLLDYYGMKAAVTVTGKKAAIKPETEPNPIVKRLIEETLKKWCPGLDGVEFGAVKKEVPGKTAAGGEAQATPGEAAGTPGQGKT